jgi:Arc/MetJ-type ribon-helix-helix transcriptional regulator
MSNPYDPNRPEFTPEPIDDLMIREDDEEGEPEPRQTERTSSSVRETLHRIPESLSSIGSSIGRSIERAISAKDDYVVAVKLSHEAQDKIDQLVAAGVFRSRAEAAAFLIDEGIRAQEPLFDHVAQKLSEIERLRAELRGMVKAE